MQNSKIKIILVDDHPVMVDGLRLVLESTGMYEVIGESYNGTELLRSLTRTTPDIIIMDINMPGMDGIKCTKIVKETYPTIKILILTMYNERAFVNQLIVAGADGCLLKSKGSKEVLAALERIANNKSYFDSVKYFKKDTQVSQAIKLGEREVEVVKLICEGLTSYQIADKMCIAEATVKTHRKNIFKKLSINNVAQLMRYAVNNDLT